MAEQNLGFPVLEKTLAEVDVLQSGAIRAAEYLNKILVQILIFVQHPSLVPVEQLFAQFDGQRQSFDQPQDAVRALAEPANYLVVFETDLDAEILQHTRRVLLQY